MIRKLLLFLAAAAIPCLGLSAKAATTSQDLDVVITHGASTAGSLLTTFTFVNYSGATLPSGSPVSFGQGFRYGDVMLGTYPLIRDAATHTPLAGQQWDEIATWRENGGNGSWRHAVWAAWLPKDLAAGASYQVEFVTTPGSYSQTSHQPLSALCSGAAAHDLKIDLTDVRNQDDTVRDSGHATFRLCDNIANTGRDAPRHIRAGSVYDEYVVNGMFAYATSGHKDPLLYAQCNVDIFTKASDGVAPGDIRWVCHLHNSWEEVAAGRTGHAGNPGPAGFPNDPQSISYRPTIYDGSAVVLDWSGLDATIASASNPVQPASSSGCGAANGNYCMLVPSSVGANAWYYGQATRVSCSATCVGGLRNGQLYYVWPSSSATAGPPHTQYVSFDLTPSGNEPGSGNVLTGGQGSGSTRFATRVQHYHLNAWQTLDSTGQDNWSPFGATTRVTRKVYPAFTSGEVRYWLESGLVIPIEVQNTATGNFGPPYGLGGSNLYQPFGRFNVIGGGNGGTRPDIGVTNHWATKAFLTQTETDWDMARLFTFGAPIHGYSTLLDESTGRISAMNNGPPTGPGGSGNGVPYAELGALRNQMSWEPAGFQNMAPLSAATNPAGFAVTTGPLRGTGLDHMPEFNGNTYAVFGDRHFLDLMQWHGNRDFAQQRIGPGPVLGQGYYRDNNAVGPDGNVHHYWGLTTICCQGRGSAWLTRDVIIPATFGADNSPERQYFNDLVTETSNYWPLFLAARDGPGSTGYSASIYGPDEPDTFAAGVNYSGFVGPGYAGGVAYIGETHLHTPMFSTWNTSLQRLYEGVGGNQLPGAYPGLDYYLAAEDLQPHIHDGSAIQPPWGVGEGKYLNGTDATDFGVYDTGLHVNPNGLVQFSGYYVIPLQSGDTTKLIYNGWGAAGDPFPPIDQLPGDRWFAFIGPFCNFGGACGGYDHSGYLQCTAADHAAYPTQCPVAGRAFTGFTRGGVPITVAEDHYPKVRFTYDPGPNQGYANPNYQMYIGQEVMGLTILGYNTSHVMANFLKRCGPYPRGGGCYKPDGPSWWWDPTVVVPGLPPAVSTVP